MNRNKGLKRVLSLLCAFVILISMLPQTALVAYAEDDASADNALAGKTIACVGDSITAAYGVTKDETDYVKLLAAQLGMDYIRLGVSGTTLCTDGSRTCNIGKLTEANLQGADVVTIAMGINDFCAAAEVYYELGDIHSTDSSTVYGAARMWCERIEELRETDSLSHTQFYFVTPVITSWNNSVTTKRDWDQSKTNIHGYTLRDLCNAIMEVAALYDVAVIDLNLLSGMYYVDAQDNNTAVFGGDGVHPGEKGHEMMATAMANVLLQNNLRDDHTHTFGSWITTTWPSCCEGEQQRVCTVCSATESRALELHNYSAVVTAPTCTEQGYTTYTCSACGDSYVDSYVDAAGHSYENGVCAACNAEHPNLANFEGKVISILSASTSTFAGYIPVADGFNLEHRARYPQDNLLTDVNETWWMQVIHELDAKLGINDSWAGSTVSNFEDTNSGDLGPDAAMASLTRIENLGANGTPDVILFYGGGNDMGRGVTLGSFDPSTAPTEVDLTASKWDSFADAYVATIMRLQYFYPDTEIVVIMSHEMPSYVTAAKLDQYGPVMKVICDHYGVKYVDLRDCGITFDMLPDNVHPNAEGMDYITADVLDTVLNRVDLESGENVVYPVTHNLINAGASLHYYKGISAGESFVEIVSGENATVTVTMGGVDVTAQVYANGNIHIPSVTGELIITAKGTFDADGHLQRLPDDICAGVNLWTALTPENIYYTATGWGNTSAGTTWSITFPVTPGERIWASSLGAAPANGSTANGVRITWFDENGVLATLDRNTVYQEFAQYGYITVPEGAAALNLPMTNNQSHYAVYILSAEHNFVDDICTICGSEHTNPELEGHLQQLPENICSGTNLWTALTPENIYYLGAEWGLYANAPNVHSVTIAVTPGDKLWATSFGPASGDKTGNGTRITWFDENGVLESVSRDVVYNEFLQNGYITVPEGAIAVNIPMPTGTDTWELYILNRDHCYENGICLGCGQTEELTHAQPESQGVANAIARAYALTDVTWTPVSNVPGVDLVDGEWIYKEFEAGKTYQGIPYSGVIATDTYVGLNVSLESFLSAVADTNSVLYTQNLFSDSYPKAAAYYGTVCSKFAQYVLDIPGSYNTSNIPNIPGMDTIALPGEYTLDQIRLGDVVVDTSYHTAVCTDILYHSDGSVAYIEISEAMPPAVRRLLWSPDAFYAEFANYRLCRYQHIDEVPAAKSGSVGTDFALMPRYGDKYNYPVSSTRGVVDILAPGYSKAVILRDGVKSGEIALDDATSTFEFDRSVPGCIEMYLEKADGSRSASVYACVVESSVEVTDGSEFTSGKLTVEFNGSSGTPMYVQVGSAHAIFCNVEGQQGTAELSFQFSSVSTQQVRIAYQNAYGIYLSPWASFTTAPNTSTDPYLSQAGYWDGYTLTPSSSTPVVQDGKTGYWTYTMIPVEENTTYYSEGSNRMWFFDENKNPIATYNAYKDSNVPFQFTTPEGTAYVSISYAPELVEKGAETMTQVSAIESLSLRYDDHYDVSGKTVEIVNAGTQSFPVVSVVGEYLVATGIGNAQVKIDGTTYNITVDKAKVNLVMVVGQSNSGNHFANSTSGVTCPIGTAYYWGYGATEPEDYTQPSMGFHAPLLAELYAQSVAAGDPVKNVLLWEEGYTSKNGKSITAWAVEENGVINTAGTDGAAEMIRDCLAYYEQRSDRYEVMNKVVFCNHGTTDHSMDPQRYIRLFTAMWERLKDTGMEYLAFLRVRGAHSLYTPENSDVYYNTASATQFEMVRTREDMFMATTLAEAWTGPASTVHSIDVRNYITVMDTYGRAEEYTDSYGNQASYADSVLTTTMKELYGSNNKIHYGLFGYGLIGADAAYNMYAALNGTRVASVTQTDSSGMKSAECISSMGSTQTLDIENLAYNLSFYPTCGSPQGTMRITVMSEGDDITEKVVSSETSTFGTISTEALRCYVKPEITVYYTCGDKTEAVTYTLVFDHPCNSGHNYECMVTAPTCMEKGYTTHTCSVCGDSYTDDEKAALAHDMGEWEVAQDATCTEDGTKRRDCSRCDHFETEAIEAPGHAYEAVVTKPTCTEKGYTTHTCSACGDSYTDDEKAALGHDWSVATCTEAKTCSVCKTTEGKATGHVYDDNVDGICNSCSVHREEVEAQQVVHMFRMYNPNTGEHFYTGSEVERENLIGHGWQYEGVGFTFPANTGAPVHRLFQPSTGEHLYTMDEDEMNRLIAEGWNYEGIAFNSAYDTEAVQHRLHNPNVIVGAYHFTFSLEEKQTLIDAGWEYQGIGWYSCWK